MEALEKVMKKDSTEQVKQAREEITKIHQQEMQDLKEEHQKEMDVSNTL